MKTWMIAAAVLFAVPFSARADKVERTWKAKCATCHGASGDGKTDEAAKHGGVPDYTSAKWQASVKDPELTDAITNGVKTKDGKDNRMEGFGDKLDKDQIAGLVKYIRTLAK